MEMILDKLVDYGIIGLMLAYFLWKDRVTFEMYRSTIQKIVDQLEMMQKDIETIKLHKDEK